METHRRKQAVLREVTQRRLFRPVRNTFLHILSRANGRGRGWGRSQQSRIFDLLIHAIQHLATLT